MSAASTNFTGNKECPSYDPTDPANSNQQIYVQLVLSLALGLSAFLGFCVSLDTTIFIEDVTADY
jgi:hypothetical protein